MALAAGFGLNFETCDPLIFDEVLTILEEQSKEAERNRLEDDLRQRMGQ